MKDNLESTLIENIERLCKILEDWMKRKPLYKEVDFIIRFFYCFDILPLTEKKNTTEAQQEEFEIKLSKVQKRFSEATTNFKSSNTSINYIRIVNEYRLDYLRKVGNLINNRALQSLNYQVIASVEHMFPHTLTLENKRVKAEFSNVNKIKSIITDASESFRYLEDHIEECLDGIQFNNIIKSIEKYSKINPKTRNIIKSNKLRAFQELCTDLNKINKFYDYLKLIVSKYPDSKVSDNEGNLLFQNSKLLNLISRYRLILGEFCILFALTFFNRNILTKNIQKEYAKEIALQNIIPLFDGECFQLLLDKLSEKISFKEPLHSIDYENIKLECISNNSSKKKENSKDKQEKKKSKEKKEPEEIKVIDNYIEYISPSLCLNIYNVTIGVLFEFVSKIYFINFLNLSENDATIKKKNRKNIYIVYLIDALLNWVTDCSLQRKWFEGIKDRVDIEEDYFKKHKTSFSTDKASTKNKAFKKKVDEAIDDWIEIRRKELKKNKTTKESDSKESKDN